MLDLSSIYVSNPYCATGRVRVLHLALDGNVTFLYVHHLSKVKAHPNANVLCGWHSLLTLRD